MICFVRTKTKARTSSFAASYGLTAPKQSTDYYGSHCVARRSDIVSKEHIAKCVIGAIIFSALSPYRTMASVFVASRNHKITTMHRIVVHDESVCLFCMICWLSALTLTSTMRTHFFIVCVNDDMSFAEIQWMVFILKQMTMLSSLTFRFRWFEWCAIFCK